MALVTALLLSSPAGAATTYIDPQGKFSVLVPDGFDVDPHYVNTRANVSAVGFVATNLQNAAVVVSISTGLPADMNVEAFAQSMLREVEASPGFVLSSDGVWATTLSGRSAISYTFVATAKAGKARVIETFAVVGHDGYGVFLFANVEDFDAFTRPARSIVDSLVFLPSADRVSLPQRLGNS